MSKNDITGDSIRNKPLSKEGEENFDNIFRKNKVAPVEDTSDQSLECSTCFCDGGCKNERNKAIAQNGNVGYDLDAIYQQVEKDYNK
jgi:hypothetical protein